MVRVDRFKLNKRGQRVQCYCSRCKTYKKVKEFTDAAIRNRTYLCLPCVREKSRSHRADKDASRPARLLYNLRNEARVYGTDADVAQAARWQPSDIAFIYDKVFKGKSVGASGKKDADVLMTRWRTRAPFALSNLVCLRRGKELATHRIAQAQGERVDKIYKTKVVARVDRYMAMIADSYDVDVPREPTPTPEPSPEPEGPSAEELAAAARLQAAWRGRPWRCAWAAFHAIQPQPMRAAWGAALAASGLRVERAGGKWSFAQAK